ncbi:MAG: helix-turn-helix domain-containing protein, partial [Cyanobacteria bacterium P01_D01_bin.2]
MAPSAADNQTVSQTHTLQGLMQRAGIPSQRALAEKAEVSRWQVQQLHQGKVSRMRLAVLEQLAAALDCSLAELLAVFDTAPPAPLETIAADEALRQEYARLQLRLEQQAQDLRHQFQVEALGILESWLTYWPTAAKAATEQSLEAKKLLPLVQPLERLVASWGVTTIGTIGEELSYDPQRHQLVRGTAQPGTLVRINHVGYHHGDRLLLRAKVV